MTIYFSLVRWVVGRIINSCINSFIPKGLPVRSGLEDICAKPKLSFNDYYSLFLIVSRI